jgi:hypothetical protein
VGFSSTFLAGSPPYGSTPNRPLDISMKGGDAIVSDPQGRMNNRTQQKQLFNHPMGYCPVDWLYKTKEKKYNEI